MQQKIVVHAEVQISDIQYYRCDPKCGYYEEHVTDGSTIEGACKLFNTELIGGNHRCRACLQAPPPTGAPKECPDCGAKPGEKHKDGCDTERCSVCGGQRISCACRGHDKAFARWSGYWPGVLESQAMGIDLNRFSFSGWDAKLFIKPKNERQKLKSSASRKNTGPRLSGPYNS